MIAELKPYPAMKDSGVPWLGKVPEHWEAVPLFAIARPKRIVGEQHRELLSIYLDRGVIRFSEAQEKRTNVTSEDLSKYQSVDPGDFVLNNQQAWRGSVGVSKYAGIVSPAYMILSLDLILNPDFANRLFRNQTMVAQYLVSSKGVGSIQRNLYWPHLKRVLTLLPPLHEQAAIVRFLDHYDRKIRRYIRAKQKLIKLLEEQKQAIIHHAVTRGLDPDVRLKTSGVEWLGDIPAKWKVLRIKQCARTISKGTTPSTEGREILDHGPIRFLKAENIAGGRIVDSPGCFIDEDTHAVLRRSQLEEGDVLFVIAGATLGKVSVVHADLLPANTNQAVAFVRPNDRIVPDYLAMWLQSARVKELVWLNAVQTAQPNLSMADLGAFLILVPAVHEQQKIVVALKGACGKIDEAILQMQQEITLLREYRTRMIADVVTGKLDVREAAAQLPDEGEELESFEEADILIDEEKEAADDLDAIPEEAEV